MEWFFPIDKIEKNAKVGLWGVGDLGNKIIEWNKRFNYCRIPFIYDKRKDSLKIEDSKIKVIEEYEEGEVDYILVSILGDIEDLRCTLNQTKIDMSKVVFMSDGYIKPGQKECYSQGGEDILMYGLLRRLNIIENIKFIDIGANNPSVLNNTYLIEEKLKIEKGVLIEPNPILCEKIKKCRPKNICLNIGITSVDEDKELTFYIFNPSTLSTFSEDVVEENINNGFKLEEIKKIECRNINKILEENFGEEEIDLISIDTEGMDGEIIKSIDYDIYAPTIICVETAGYGMGKDRDGFECIEFLIKKGYVVYADTFLNTIFVKKEKIEKYCKNIKTIFPN